jgi:LPS O-antigen subunit length determinant protein (WzzB/FepE family)
MNSGSGSVSALDLDKLNALFFRSILFVMTMVAMLAPWTRNTSKIFSPKWRQELSLLPIENEGQC